VHAYAWLRNISQNPVGHCLIVGRQWQVHVEVVALDIMNAGYIQIIDDSMPAGIKRHFSKAPDLPQAGALDEYAIAWRALQQDGQIVIARVELSHKPAFFERQDQGQVSAAEPKEIRQKWVQLQQGSRQRRRKKVDFGFRVTLV
jgi:hypothetical protein